MEYQAATLANGLRILHIRTSSPVTHIGLFVNAGTRDEDRSLNGLAHFIEHTIFKGTTRRKSYHVLTRLENVGGDLNAYTTKEETCIYATVLSQHCERAIELISDIALNSTFPDRELKKEKDVIIDEINSYKDSPAEEIYDDFEEMIYRDHPLGMNILGTKEHVMAFRREHILNFMHNYYLAGNMILCSTGTANFEKVVRLAEKYFGPAPSGRNGIRRDAFTGYDPRIQQVKKNTFQTHCIIGCTAFSRKDERRIPLFLLNNILGGPAMNSRLSLAVRERHGYAYNIESVFLPYTDSGVFSIYIGTDHNHIDKVHVLVNKELKKLRLEKMGSLQFSQAKNQLIGQIAIANESNLGRMMSHGKAFLHENRVDSFDEIRRKIENISREQLQDIANIIFNPDGLSMLTFN